MARIIVDVYAPRPNGRIVGYWTLHDLDSAMSDADILQLAYKRANLERHGGERGYLIGCLEKGNYAIIR